MRKLVASFYTFIFWNAVLERVSKFPLSYFPVLNSLKESYEQALRRDDVKAIVVTGKIWYLGDYIIIEEFLTNISLVHCGWAGANGKFSGGFDITAFGGIQEGKSMFLLFKLFNSSAVFPL